MNQFNAKKRKFYMRVDVETSMTFEIRSLLLLFLFLQ